VRGCERAINRKKTSGTGALGGDSANARSGGIYGSFGWSPRGRGGRSRTKKGPAWHWEGKKRGWTPGTIHRKKSKEVRQDAYFPQTSSARQGRGSPAGKKKNWEKRGTKRNPNTSNCFPAKKIERRPPWKGGRKLKGKSAKMNSETHGGYNLPQRAGGKKSRHAWI